MSPKAARTGIRRTIRYLELLSALLSGLLLCACGKVTDTSGLSGIWQIREAYAGKIILPESQIEEIDLRLALYPDRKGTITKADSEGSLTWQYENGNLLIETGGYALTGSFENEQLILNPEGTDLSLVFSRLPESETDLNETEPISERHNDSWYGWWKIDLSEGEIPNSWYDCCALFQMEDDGTVKLNLWDENGSRQKPLAEIMFHQGAEERLTSLNGYFLFQEIHENDWQIDMSESVIFLENIQHNAADESFSYSIYLRPWGSRWDDADPGLRPFYYEDWYLPLIQQESAMPDNIPWGSIETAREREPG